MSRTLKLRLDPLPDALDRFEAAWHLASGRTPPPPLAILSFASLPLLLKTLTPARWALLGRLRRAGTVPVYQLAKRLGRDYKNVHTDVARLVELGLIEKTAGAQVRVAWDAVRAELRLGQGAQASAARADSSAGSAQLISAAAASARRRASVAATSAPRSPRPKRASARARATTKSVQGSGSGDA